MHFFGKEVQKSELIPAKIKGEYKMHKFINQYFIAGSLGQQLDNANLFVAVDILENETASKKREVVGDDE